MRRLNFAVLFKLAQSGKVVRSLELRSAMAMKRMSGHEHTSAQNSASATDWCIRRGFAESPPDASKVYQEADETAAEIDKLIKGAAKEGSPDGIEHIVESDGENFADQNVVMAMAKLAAMSASASSDEKIAITSGRSFQTLVDMVLLGARRYTTSELLKVLDACSTLGFDDDHLIDKVSSRLLTDVQQMDGNALHNLVTSLGDLSSPSVVLFDVVQSRLEELGDKVSPQQKREIKTAYEALGYKDHADATGV